jgi:hypothetical protein
MRGNALRVNDVLIVTKVNISSFLAAGNMSASGAATISVLSMNSALKEQLKRITEIRIFCMRTEEFSSNREPGLTTLDGGQETMKNITNLEALARAQAVCKGFEDGQVLVRQYPHMTLLNHIARQPEYVSRAHVETELIPFYYQGFTAAWEKAHPNTSQSLVRDDMFPHSALAYEQAMMRDLEES